MNSEQVTFPSGPVQCAGDLYLPDGATDGAPVPGVVMGHSVVMVKEALRPHAGYLVLAGFFDQHLRRAPRFVPSPAPEEAWSQGLRPECRKAS